MTVDTTTPMLAVRVGQTVQIHGRGRLLASAVRDGRGWLLNAYDGQHQVANLEEALAIVGLLPDHHRSSR